MSLVNLVARTATREELVELLRQHDIELVALKKRAEKYEELLRIAANNAHDSGEEDSFEDTINAALR